MHCQFGKQERKGIKKMKVTYFNVNMSTKGK